MNHAQQYADDLPDELPDEHEASEPLNDGKSRMSEVMKKLLTPKLSTAADNLIGTDISVQTSQSVASGQKYPYRVLQKKLENWLYWIIVDIVYVYLYSSREAWLFALLLLIYTIIAVFGYLEWRKRYLSIA